MSANEENLTDLPAGPFSTGLWMRVREWVWQWAGIFRPGEILREGLSRRLHLRCCKWLWEMEAAARRLFLAAALAFDLSTLPAPQAKHATTRKRLSGHADARHSFRIFALHGAGKSGASAHAGAAPPPGARHLPFPADPLLRLGFTPPQRKRRVAPRYPHPHPLLNRSLKPEEDYANASSDLFGQRSPDSMAHPAPGVRQDGRSGDRRWPSPVFEVDEYRRIDAEWERVLPAPGLARRIFALVRALEAPDRPVRRLARRLASRSCLADLVRDQAEPSPPRRSYDPLGPQVEPDILPGCWRALAFPDTS